MMANQANLNFERDCEVGVAISRGYSYLDDNDFKYSVYYIGVSVKTTVFYIDSPTGLRATGSGKGLGAQSLASAMFEAFEHFFYQHSESIDEVKALPIDINTYDSFLRGGMPDFSLIKPDPKVNHLRYLFKDVTSEKFVWVPAFLLDPYYDAKETSEREYLEKTNLSRYSSNSGVASGSDLNEALLHGLLELIERDAIGIEMLTTIFKGVPNAVRIFNNDGLPEYIKETISSLEVEHGCNIKIFYIATDLNIPVSLCRLKSSNGEQQWFGAGASLQIDIAIIRSILESVQTSQLVSLNNIENKSYFSSGSGVLTNYQRCLLDYGIFMYKGGEVSIDYNDVNDGVIHDWTPKEQFYFLIDTLMESGINVFYRVIHDSFPVVVQLYSPELDKFFITSGGAMVLPGSRGKGFI